MEKSSRIHRFEIRLTADEYNALRDKATGFTSVSHYIRSAITKCSDASAIHRVNDIKKLIDFYKQYHSILFHTTANLNQAMKRANELSAAGMLSVGYIKDVLYPTISVTSDTIIFLRQELEKLTTSLSHDI